MLGKQSAGKQFLKASIAHLSKRFGARLEHDLNVYAEENRYYESNATSMDTPRKALRHGQGD